MLVLVVAGLAALVLGAPPTVAPLTLSAQSIACGERLEITASVTARFDNPSDPREIAVDGLFVSPDGRTVTVPAFVYQEARRQRDAKGRESVDLVGQPTWKLRFAPRQVGQWRLRLRAKDRDGETTSPEATFTATPGTGHGVIRRAAGTRYFEHADGTPFFPIGHNVAWSHAGGTFDFEQWLTPLPAHGVNLARIWLQWDRNLSLEYKGPRSGCGRYDLANAWRMDQVLDTCRRLGIRVLFTLDSPEPYQKEHYWLGKLTGRPWTDFCAHNVANGGPLKEPREFYTTDEGRRLIRQRLRYIVARWGWDDNLFCWELWNELNVFPEWDKLVPQIAAWHREMAGYLRRLDPAGHLITTSFTNAEGHPDIWSLPELDFVQSHVYSSVDLAGDFPKVTRLMGERYQRPHLYGEFGTRFDWLNQLDQLDPAGVHVHNMMWSAIMAGSAGTPLSWCWEYLDKSRVYQRYGPLAKFTAGVRWPSEGFRPLSVRFAAAPGTAAGPPRDLVLPCGQGAPVGDRVELDLSDPPSALGRFYLYGQAQAAQQKPRVVAVTVPQDCRLVVNIGRVWVKGILEVQLDGRPVFREELPAGPPGQGRYKTAVFDQQWKIWGSDYDLEVPIELPAGRHEVSLYNAGADGITIDRVSISHCLVGPASALRGYGLAGRTMAMAWFQNREHCLRNVAQKREIAPVRGGRVTLSGLPAGPCTVQWWDTWAGRALREERATVTAEGLVLELPELARDVAVKVQPAR